MPIKYLQFANAAIWLVTVLVLVPSFVRTITGKPRDGQDEWRSALFIAALLFTGFAGRWLVAPQVLIAWQMLYVANAVLAVYIWFMLWNRRAGK
jgi:hypothetical protein